MPWPATVSNGQQTDASQYNNLLASAQVWPTNVSAGSNALTNVSAISAPSAAALNITAAPVTFLSPDGSHNVSLSVGNTGSPSLTSTANALATTSTITVTHASGIAVMSPDATRTGRFAVANGGDPTLTTSTGTVTIGGIAKISNGAIIYFSTTATGIFYNLGFATQNSVPTCHTISVTGAAGILYIASPTQMLSTLGVTGATTYTGPVTANGLWTANALATFNAGLTVPNAQAINFLDSTNSFIQFWLYPSPGNFFNIMSRTSSSDPGGSKFYMNNAGDVTVTSANATATTLAIANTSANGRGYLIQATGTSGTTGAGFLCITDQATGNIICSLGGSISARKTIRFAASTVIGFQADDVAGGMDVGFQRISAGVLMCSDTNGNPMGLQTGNQSWYSPNKAQGVSMIVPNSGAAVVSSVGVTQITWSGILIATTSAGGFMAYSPDASRFGQFYCPNGGFPILTSNAGQVNTNVNFGCYGAGGILVYSPDQSRYFQINSANTGHPTLWSSTGVLFVSAGTFGCYGAGGMVAYSPDQSRYIQINCANAANPVIFSSTAALTISANVTFTGIGNFAGSVTVSPGNLTVSGAVGAGGRVSAGVDLYVAPSSTGSGYMQLCNNGQFGDANPWIYSSTGAIFFQATNVYLRSGGAGFFYNSANAQYVSIAQSGLNSSNGTLPVGCAMTVSALLTASAGVTINGAALQVNANVGINSGSTLYIYNSTMAQALTIGFGGGAHPALNSTTGIINFNCALYPTGISNQGGYMDNAGGVALRTLNGAPLYWYNTGSTIYGVLGWSGANPAIGSSSGILYVNNPLTVQGNLTVNANNATNGILLSLPGTAGGGMAIISPGNANTALTLGTGNNVQGGYQPYIASNSGTLNVSTNLMYVSGAVSATAHQTHGSGTDIEDIYRSFSRKEEVLRGIEGVPDDPVVPTHGWTLAPGLDGLHILVKRSPDEVVEFILPWDQARPIPTVN